VLTRYGHVIPEIIHTLKNTRHSNALLILLTIHTLFAQSTVQDVQFNVQRGFYDTPFQLTLSTATFGADIYYTTDGSNPSSSNGIL
jgi:hypothetical protein